MAQTKMLLQSIFFTFSVIFPSITAVSPSQIQALVAPITKDSLTSQYTLSFNKHHSFVLDTTGTLLWFHCSKHHSTIPCNSTKCSLAHSFHSHLCPDAMISYRYPCTCTVNPINTITQTCAVTDLTQTNFTISATDGRTPTTQLLVSQFVSSCAPKAFLKSLPVGARGMAGLSRSDLALPSQLASALAIQRKFAICLPSNSTALGVAFFGDTPIYLMPPTKFDLRSVLSYTPLLVNPMNPDYYIGVNCIAINGEAVRFLERVLEIDSIGNGGVMLSSVVPHTTLRSHIYRPFLKTFAKLTRGIPRAKKVKPFGLCLNTSRLGYTRVGYPVPQVDLMLANGKNWTIFGANSMKQINNDVACLAFVDGGERAEQAVVIGSFQMEDNLLLFDLVGSRLGFSSSLYFFRTTCGNFNFTS
ncbi:chitinase CLP-like [Tasmannia lanceolata]|uniref:chitinase CLP-like n=1 Tax=Tasmannia lanceolata TaxID=3420 RepID=UPI00406294CA